MKKANLLVLPTVLLSLMVPLLNVTQADTTVFASEKIKDHDFESKKTVSMIISTDNNKESSTNYSQSDNLLKDGDFTQKLTNWEVLNEDINLAEVATEANGNRYIHLKQPADPTYAPGIISQTISTNTSDLNHYTLTFDIKSNVNGAYMIHFFDADGNRITGQMKILDSNSSEWEKQEEVFSVNGVSSIMLSFKGDMKLDNVDLTAY
ncbi:hypothetical protein [Pediococcus pentosaceus]|uniref:hypothetical protein n=1 Tax=Pediococcus pentosaceus TaxID=1255 RepID=UPI0021A347D3|nr:hypothetical protein [Pediococcus pentosaceus]MCT3033271.1 hypothetical protein [Pediococcus pentosaceus]